MSKLTSKKNILAAMIFVMSFSLYSCENDMVEPDQATMPPKTDIRIPPYGKK